MGTEDEADLQVSTTRKEGRRRRWRDLGRLQETKNPSKSRHSYCTRTQSKGSDLHVFLRVRFPMAVQKHSFPFICIPSLGFHFSFQVKGFPSWTVKAVQVNDEIMHRKLTKWLKLQILSALLETGSRFVHCLFVHFYPSFALIVKTCKLLWIELWFQPIPTAQVFISSGLQSWVYQMLFCTTNGTQPAEKERAFWCLLLHRFKA